ncbi:PREDICTED: zonadhesin [Rhinopithecus bieti]|uniref:zonadhesin n=1 Tax=Rhinopithecus bieti TaxID=61621 RepID=UPI00083C10F1|nr:PREDICTED: zonadhesin [Rhinopithecus bieti]
MVPPVWTLLLLVGAAHLRREKPLDKKLVVRSSRDNYVLTQCDFEDDAKPLCDWSQVSADDGDWVRASGPFPTSTTGPPGGYPNGEGSYLHMESNNFHRGGVARLRSPNLWEQGPLCVNFAYHMFGLSWGAQLRLLLLSGEEGHRPHVLWKHRNTQRPSWIPTTVTVPAGFTLPTRLMFEGTRGSAAYLDIALDALSIRRGSCNRVCMMQTCSFDIPNDLCDWTWIPTASGAKWTQKKGSSGKPGVGPDGDFSSPGIASSSEVHADWLSELGAEVVLGSHYIYLEADKFSQAGQSARLVSRPFCAPGDICVEFAYHMYGLGEGTMLELLLGSPAGSPPILLWKRVGSQRPYWQNTSVTIPSGHQQPMQLIFKAIWGSNMAFVVAMGFILINPGTCPERCPPNAHYESCACPASCKSPRPSCGPLCRGGCVCNLGFLFSDNHCIQASSCNCFYNNNYYKPGAEWFSPNCTERCRCWPGSRVECQISQCGTHTVCQLKNGQYGCHPYAGTATCLVYGDPHYVTFDGRHFGFMGRCSYILAQPCGNSTDPFFRVTAKNEEQGQEGVSCLSKVYVTLPETTVTLLKGRRTLVEGQRVTLPAIPSKGVFLGASGRFVELQTEFGLRVRWDGGQQLYVTVSSTYSGKLCGLCGNYDGNSDNDHLKSDGSPARDKEELGNSWQTDQDEDQECQKHQVVNPPSCDSSLQSSMSGPGFCGRLVDTRGPFETCLLHVKATSFFDSCMLDMCRFQGLQHLLCTHMSTMTTTCQDAGHAVKPWREPHFCPMACPPNSKYSLCAKPCPDTCHSGFTGMFCSDRCVEACECNPGFVLSGLECVPRSQCGCLHPAGSYFKVGERWYKPGCKELCVCESNNRIRCQPWRCRAQEFCGLQNGIYGCHAQGAATCTASGDPHYLTFDGALHHFMGTCTYVLTRPCWSRSQDSYFVVSATNENRGGNLEVSYIKAVHVTVFDLSISLLRGCKVMLNGHRVALPVWPAQGRVTIRLSSNFVLLYTNFGLQVRYDGSHLVEVTVPSSYGGQLCGLCGNYNNNSLDDNQRPDRKPAGDSVQLGAAWKLPESSEPGCFLVGGKPSSCQENSMADAWNKNCAILINPQGPFSQCHQVVPPQSSFASCVHGQCGTRGDTTALCRSLQAYASLCARAGQAPAWRNRTFCPMRCPPGSSYSPCGSPCPATCSSINDPRDCPKALPCAESCECQKGYILSGTSCVPLGQCGCTDPAGSYHPVGERWYTEDTCTRLCTCSIHNNITCFQSTCKPNQMCWALDGLLRCRVSALECPAYSSYTNCLPSCSPSCWDLDGRCEGAKVPSACAEGCICQPGYVLSEDKCVPRSQCGCKDAHGGSIPLGKSWVSRGCTEKCVCTGGAIQCGDFRCPSGSHCQLSSDNSKSNCVSDKSEQCSVYGDPHYLTFDGFSYRFQGRMTYVLIKTVDVLPEGVEPLLVEGRNKMDPRRSSTFLQEVITTVYGYKVQLQAGLELVVNNQKMAVPYRPNEHLRVTLRGQRLYLVTDFELVISFGGRKNAVISLPSMYEGLVRGLCGNYDKNRKNDMMLPSGALTQNLNTFGNSWEVKTEDVLLRLPRAIPVEERRGVELSFHVSECSPEQLASNSTQACRVLADPQGPFAACHQTVAAEPFQEHCMLDLCSTQDPREQEELRCQVLSGYAILCQEAGTVLAGWRDRTLCAMECPAGTMYQSCMTPCPASCANLPDPGDCEGPCVEGCASIPGYAYSGTQSLPLADCGCTSNGIYYQLGSSFVTEDCSQRCTCASSRILLCEPFSCREGEVCTLGNHTRGCFPGEPAPLPGSKLPHALGHPWTKDRPFVLGTLPH